MFYDAAKRDHGLPQDPLKSLVVPRPIGWISTVDRQGRVNLAPYSFYNAVSEFPPIVCFAITNPKGISALRLTDCAKADPAASIRLSTPTRVRICFFIVSSFVLRSVKP